MDAKAGLQFLRDCRDIDRRKIIVFGRSLGGAVAIRLTAELHRDRSGPHVQERERERRGGIVEIVLSSSIGVNIYLH